MPKKVPVVDRVLKDATETADGCWIPGLKPNSIGYVQVHLAGKLLLAHRVIYEEFRGQIPDGLVLDHLCRNRACCNPEHLDPVTTRVNVLRGSGPVQDNAVKTRCIHGHPFDAANTYVCSRGWRQCRTCKASRGRRAKRVA